MGVEPKGGDKWARGRASRLKGTKTSPEQLKALFDAFKSNGGNIYAASKTANVTYSIARYYIKKAADPKYAQKRDVPPEISQTSWIRQSAFDMKLNDLIEITFKEIEEKLKTASLPDTVRAQRELLSLRRYIMSPITPKEKAEKKAESAPPPEPEEDVSTLLARAAARKAKEKSRPLGDTTPEAPIEEAPAEM